MQNVEFKYEENKDFAEFKKKFKYYAGFDNGIMIAGIGFIGFSILVMYGLWLFCAAGMLAMVGIVIWRIIVRKSLKQKELMKAYGEHINSKKKEYISSFYDVSVICDSSKRVFSVYKDSKEEISIAYDDINEYKILLDETLNTGKRIPEFKKEKYSKYSIVINDEIYITFDNKNKYFKMLKPIRYQMNMNKDSINKIATMLDKILKKK